MTAMLDSEIGKAMQEAKTALRREMSERRSCVPASLREQYSIAICDALDGIIVQPATVAVYLAMEDEISLDAFIGRRANDLRLAAPRWDAQARTYALAQLTGAPYAPGRWGIREPPPDAAAIQPRDVDWWIVPGLAFTSDGQRLGYGGGFYDRFLAAAKPSARAIAVAFPFQIVESLPVCRYDRPVDRVLTIDEFKNALS